MPLNLTGLTYRKRVNHYIVGTLSALKALAHSDYSKRSTRIIDLETSEILTRAYGPQAPLGPSPASEATPIKIGWETVPLEDVATIW